MDDLLVRQIVSLDALESVAASWNDLWRRSQTARPTSRAEQLVLWSEAFAEGSLAAIVVEHQGRLVAALPLTRAQRWPFEIARTPGNAWTCAGEVLLDPSYDADELSAAILTGVRQCFRGLLWLDGLVLGTAANRSLLAQCESQKISSTVRQRFTVPMVELAGSRGAYFASRSRNTRRQLQAINRRGEQVGGIELVRYENLRPRQAETIARECFQLEAAGWKGASYSAVLNCPPAAEFFLAQARQLAVDGQLAIAALRHRGQLIAFEYGWQSHGVRSVLKIGYHERYAKLSPGQLLRFRLLGELFAEGTTRWIDFLGPISRATQSWATHRYEVGRALCAIGSPAARMALAACRTKRRLLRSSPVPGQPTGDPAWPLAVPEKCAVELAEAYT